MDTSHFVVRGSLNKPNMEKIESNVFFLHSLWKLDLALRLRACIRDGGGPQIGEETSSGSPHLSCKRDQINMRYYMDKRVTSLSLGPGPYLHVNRPEKHALLMTDESKTQVDNPL